MKRLILCFDGTWNAVQDPDTVTNVVKLAEAVRSTAKDGVTQAVYYNSGVGSGGRLDQFVGGTFGYGLRGNVKRGLAFLSLNYEPGDEIYLFGFSRGAYSARALAGVIGAAGIPKQIEFRELERVWNYYRLRPKFLQRRKRKAELREELSELTWRPEIECVGVWDTVGSYGIPAGYGLGALARLFTAWTRGFHDSEIGKHIKVGLHALAVDERRRPFAPNLWAAAKDQGRIKSHVEQVWFPGSHSNIGGGYANCGLSDLALTWMIARVSALTALEFDQSELSKRIWPCATCILYYSNHGWPISRIRPNIRRILPKSALSVRALLWNSFNRKREHVNELIHWSVLERRDSKATQVDGKRTGKYAPRNIPAAIPEERIAGRTDEEMQIIGATRTRKPQCDCARS
jgi:uncharacterized protein (DUF2235 family)